MRIIYGNIKDIDHITGSYVLGKCIPVTGSYTKDRGHVSRLDFVQDFISDFPDLNWSIARRIAHKHLSVNYLGTHKDSKGNFVALFMFPITLDNKPNVDLEVLKKSILELNRSLLGEGFINGSILLPYFKELEELSHLLNKNIILVKEKEHYV